MINIRKATVDDLPGMKFVYRKAFKREAIDFKKLLRGDSDYHTFIAVDDIGDVVGMVTLWREDGRWTVMNLAVHPDYQGEGIGKFLLVSALVQFAMTYGYVGLYWKVKTDNVESLNFYLKNGATIVEAVNEDGISKMVMSYDLTNLRGATVQGAYSRLGMSVPSRCR